MSAPKVHLSCDDVNDALRRVAVNTLEIAAQELDRQIRNSPCEERDPGRKWAVTWLQTLANSLRNEEEKDHDKTIEWGGHRG